MHSSYQNTQILKSPLQLLTQNHENWVCDAGIALSSNIIFHGANLFQLWEAHCIKICQAMLLQIGSYQEKNIFSLHDHLTASHPWNCCLVLFKRRVCDISFYIQAVHSKCYIAHFCHYFALCYKNDSLCCTCRFIYVSILRLAAILYDAALKLHQLYTVNVKHKLYFQPQPSAGCWEVFSFQARQHFFAVLLPTMPVLLLTCFCRLSSA